VLGVLSGELWEEMEEAKHDGVGREMAVKRAQALVVIRPDRPHVDDAAVMQWQRTLEPRYIAWKSE
jgi:hypothetical protein